MTDQNKDQTGKPPTAAGGGSRSKKKNRAKRRAAQALTKQDADSRSTVDADTAGQENNNIIDPGSQKQLSGVDTLDNLPLITDAGAVAMSEKPESSDTLHNLPVLSTGTVDISAGQTGERSSETTQIQTTKSMEAPNKVPTELKIAGSYPGVHVPQPSSKRVSPLPAAAENETSHEVHFLPESDDIQNPAKQDMTAAELNQGENHQSAEANQQFDAAKTAVQPEAELQLSGENSQQIENSDSLENGQANADKSQPSGDSPSSTGSGLPALPAGQKIVGPLPKSVPHLLRKTGTFAAADPPSDGSNPVTGGTVGPKSGRHTSTLTRIVFSESLSHQEETIGSIKSPVEELKKSIDSKKENVKFNLAMTKDLFRVHPIVSSLGVASAIILLLSCGALTQGLSKTFYNTGVAQVNSQNYQAAIVSFDRALSLRGDFADALLNRGNCYFALGDFDKAWSDFNAILQISPTNVQAMERRAATNLELGKNEDAVRDYQQLAMIEPDALNKSADSLTNLGAAYFAQEQYGQALEQFNKAVSLFPSEVRPHLKRAMCYEGLKQYDQAAKDYNQVLKLEPANVKALINRARCFQQTGNFSDDLVYLTRALAIQPKNAQANKYLGIHYARLHDPDKALAALDKAISSNRMDAQSYQERAVILTEKGEVRKALSDLQSLKSLPGFETDSKYYLGLAKLHMSATNFTGAVEDLNQLMSADPEQKSAYLLKRAECYAAMKDYKKALADCATLLQEKPNDNLALISHGRYSLIAGNRRTAIEDYSQAIKNSPRNANAYMARGEVYLLEKQGSSAADDFKHALVLQPNSIDAKEKLAAANLQMNQIAGSALKPIATGQTKKSTVSKATLDEIAKMDSAALMQNGYAALKKGNTDYAVAALSRAVTQKPNDPGARQYLFYALTAAGEADAAVEQWNALEKLGVDNIATDLKCAQSIARCGNKQIGGGCWEHMIAKYATDEGALIRIAKTCADCDYKDKAIEACDKGLEHPRDLNHVRELNRLRIALSGDSGESSAQTGAPQSSTAGKRVGR